MGTIRRGIESATTSADVLGSVNGVLAGRVGSRYD